ncbi:MAG: hypothetical protein LC659_00250 [Myxococcales bacterium]|nr:hypothetical protein [Myxococcales bacterium]
MGALVAATVACVPVVAVGGESPRLAEPLKEALPFIEDDYARAIREATKNKLPIFVDAWAPW